MFDVEKHVTSENNQQSAVNTSVSIMVHRMLQYIFLWEKNQKGQWVATKEYYYSGTEMRLHRRQMESTRMTWKSSWKESMLNRSLSIRQQHPLSQSLRNEDLKVKKAKNDVLDGIRFVGNLLNLGLLLFSENCKETIKEFGSYIWDDKALERGEDKPVKQHDHCMDAVRYFAYTI